MQLTTRRWALAAVGTLAMAGFRRKLRAEELESIARLVPTDPPKPMPEIGFADAGGKPHTLTEFRDHGMVLNLWATWCMPCIAEMAALAALSRTLAPDDIAVLPLSSDRGGVDAVKRFYAAHEITALPVLIDQKGAAVAALGASGIPTTIIVDKQGRERARLEGAANWATPEAAQKVRSLVG
ncbi:MAG: redoxin family protein [Acetobacteraceae bacterium]|nr:redoxin family protein [Acetobacteraceae bacterium]